MVRKLETKLDETIRRQRPLLPPYSEPYVAVDTETTGLDVSHKDVAFAVSACTHNGERYFWQWDIDPNTRQASISSQMRSEIKGLIDAYPDIVFHNAKFDLQALATIDLIVPNRVIIHDTVVAAHVLGEETKGLKDLALLYLNIPADDESELRTAVVKARALLKNAGYPRGEKVQYDYWAPFFFRDKVPEFREVLKRYAIRDAERTALLWRGLGPLLDKEGLVFQYHREMAVVPMIDFMEREGVPFKSKLAHKRHGELRHRCNVLCDQMSVFAGFDVNPRSPDHLAKMLHDVAGLPVISKTPTGKPATDAATIQDLSDRYSCEALQDLQEFKQCNKAVTDIEQYLGKQHWTKVHFHYNTVGTKTTRFSSTNPNGQNIAKSAAVPLRDLFGPPMGWRWLDVDYDQLELRIFAELSQERVMMEAFSRGKDLHQITADGISKIAGREVDRALGKRVNFAWIYGARPKKLGILIGVEADALDLAMRTTYPRAVEWFNEVQSRGRREGFVYSGFGFRIPVPPQEAYKGVNYIIQSTAGDVLKNAIIRIHDYLTRRKLYDSIRPLLTIHDELVFQIHKSVSESHLRELCIIMEMSGRDVGVHTPVGAKIISGGRGWSKGRTWKP